MSRDRSSEPGGSGRPLTVLLAEDEESFVEALVIGLTHEGFRVTVARDGVEALHLFEENEPDLVLLDLMLPKMSGIDVCRAIRARSTIPIIMVTAKGSEIDVVVVREGKNLKGWVLGLVLRTIGTQILEKAFVNSLKAIEARNSSAKQQAA